MNEGTHGRINYGFGETQGHGIERKVPLAFVGVKPSHLRPQRKPKHGLRDALPMWSPCAQSGPLTTEPYPLFFFTEQVQCPLKAEATGPFLPLDA